MPLRVKYHRVSTLGRVILNIYLNNIRFTPNTFFIRIIRRREQVHDDRSKALRHTDRDWPTQPTEKSIEIEGYPALVTSKSLAQICKRRHWETPNWEEGIKWYRILEMLLGR